MINGFHGIFNGILPPKVACPIHKNTYNLETGKGISNPGFNLATFEVKVEGGRVSLKVHRWNRNPGPQPRTFGKLVFLIECS